MYLFGIWLSSTLLVSVGSGQGITVDSFPPVVAGYLKQELRYTGELTRKGSDADSWWALRVQSGAVYRLHTVDTTLEKSFLEWQNSRVTVVGTVNGKFLSFEVICVREASRG